MTCTVATGRVQASKSAASILFAVLLGMATPICAEPLVFESTDTPPFWSASLPDNGLGGAILALISANAGVQYSIEYLPVKRFRNSQAPYVVGDPDILFNQKRRAIFPIGIFNSAFFYYKPHHDVIEFRHLQDLQGHTLGVLRGTLEDKGYFERNGISVEESDSVESLLGKMRRGRVDFCILVDAAGQYAIKQMFPEERDSFAQVVIPGSVRPIAIMIDIETPEGRAVARRYRQVLDSTLHSRRYHEILESYYGKDSIPGDSFEQLKKFQRYYAAELGN